MDGRTQQRRWLLTGLSSPSSPSSNHCRQRFPPIFIPSPCLPHITVSHRCILTGRGSAAVGSLGNPPCLHKEFRKVKNIIPFPQAGCSFPNSFSDIAACWLPKVDRQCCWLWSGSSPHMLLSSRSPTWYVSYSKYS